VEAHLIPVPECASQQAFILVDENGERTVLWRRDGKLALLPSELKREWITNARVLHVDGYDTAAAATAAEWARAAGVAVVADLDDTYSGVEALLANVDYLIVSRDFPERLCGEAALEKSLPRLQRQYKSRLTAATLGSGGVLAWDGERFRYACAYQVPVADTTGAGDIFHAAFIYGLIYSWPLQRQLEFACAAAALNCTAIGARGKIAAVEAIERLMTSGARHPAVDCGVAI
jgi:sulfofructose kinase